MKLVYAKLSELLTEVKARGKVDGVRVGAMMSSTIEAGLPTYTGWIIVSVHGDCFDTWAEWRLATGRQRAEVTEKGVHVPDKLTAFTEEKLAEVRGWIEAAGLAMRDGILAADTEAYPLGQLAESPRDAEPEAWIDELDFRYLRALEGDAEV